MSSAALEELERALAEVNDLQRANPTPPGGLPQRPKVVRAINRASVVLLHSHFERYLRRVNEEALDLLNEHNIQSDNVPERIRLEHSHVPIVELAVMRWENRANRLTQFVAEDAWLWGEAPRAPLDSQRLLRWFTSPTPKKLRRFYRMWGINDIFSEITRARNWYVHLEFKIEDLVGKRSNIAHGDFTAEATYQDVASYRKVVWMFSERADRRLRRVLRRDLDVPCDW
jgi:hypothetical protein